MVDRAACERLLAGLEVSFAFQPAITTPECPAPLPLTVARIGAVELRPAATLTCPMVAALARWLAASVQPAGRQLLGAPVKAIAQVSSHRCHGNALRASGRIGEHALANALDIAAFELTDGRIVSIRQHWGPVARRGSPPPVAAVPTTDAVKRQVGVAPQLPTPAQRLGGAVPRTPEAAAPQLSAKEPAQNAQTQGDGTEQTQRTFLLRIHKEACGPFATVLGPEANDAHLDHFHLDLATRKGRAFCE